MKRQSRKESWGQSPDTLALLEASGSIAARRKDEVVHSLMADLVAVFEKGPFVVRKSLERLCEYAPADFFCSAVLLLQVSESRAASDYLRSLIRAHDLHLEPLIRPEFCSLEEACRLALHIARIDPNVEFKLVNRIRPEERRPASVERTIRILTVLERISKGSGILVRIIKFARHPEPKVRQLATRLIVRGQGDCRWTSNLLADPDPEVRVSGIEEIARLAVKDAERILSDALHDIHAEVRIAALAGLCRRQVASAAERLQNYGVHADPRIRICAYRAMGRLELAQFLPFLQQRALEDIPGVRGEALQAAARIQRAGRGSTDSPW
jgi:hypothetical protein